MEPTAHPLPWLAPDMAHARPQHSPAQGMGRARIVAWLPEWRRDPADPLSLPTRWIPVLTELARNGIAVDWWCESITGTPDQRILAAALEGAAGLLVWCEGRCPHHTIPGVREVLRMARQEAPEQPRLVAGGFWGDSSEPASIGSWGTVLTGSADPEAVAAAMTRLAGLDSAAGWTDPHELHGDGALPLKALEHVDLLPFLHPDPTVFGNMAPALHMPARVAGRRCIARELGEMVARARASHMFDQLLLSGSGLVGDRRQLRDVADSIRERVSGCRWGLREVSVSEVLQAPDELWSHAAASGLTSVWLDTFAGTDTGLRTLGRDHRVVGALRAHERLADRGITPVHEIVLGYPGESRWDRRATMDLVDRLARRDGPVRFRFRTFLAETGTPAGERVLRRLRPLPTSAARLETWRFDPNRCMPWLPSSQERKLQELVHDVLPARYPWTATHPSQRGGLRFKSWLRSIRGARVPGRTSTSSA